MTARKRPLATGSHLIKLMHHKNILAAWRVSGCSKKEWAERVGYSVDNLDRYIKGRQGLDFSKWNEQQLRDTAEAFGISYDSLIAGGVPFNASKPEEEPFLTTAEFGRYSTDMVASAYDQLDEDEQRAVTKVIEGFIAAKQANERHRAQLESEEAFLESVAQDGISDEGLNERLDGVKRALRRPLSWSQVKDDARAWGEYEERETERLEKAIETLAYDDKWEAFQSQNE